MTSKHWLNAIKFNSDGLIPAIAQDHHTGRVLMMAWMNAESLELTAQSNTAVYFSRSRQALWHKGETSGHTQKVHSIRLDCDTDVIVLSVTQVGGIACHTGRESCFYQELDLSGNEPVWQTVDAVLKDPQDIYQSLQPQSAAPANQFDTSVNKEILAGLQANSTHASHESILPALDDILKQRKTAEPDSSYVASLYHKGINKILEKVGEEAIEAIIAAKDYQASCTNEHTNNVTNTVTLATQENSQQHKDELIYEIADVWFHTLVTLSWFNLSSDVILIELARRFGLSGIDEKAARKAK